jgi:cystathionine beta-lyase/cystathionine gamma-synthase
MFTHERHSAFKRERKAFSVLFAFVLSSSSIAASFAASAELVPTAMFDRSVPALIKTRYVIVTSRIR